MADLRDYHRKRDAAKTPEPMPETVASGGNNDLFVIQEHHARRLHWDVRLERDGVLASWAVPKGLPVEQGDIRLAVHTEDHPMEYLTFSGEIPRGEYGGGKMTIWDTGRYDTLKWSEHEVEVVFHGARAQGRYVFFRSDRRDRDGKNWMVRLGKQAAGKAPPRVPPPEKLSPMLATRGLLPGPEQDEQFSYEFKWDGVRAIARITGGRLQLLARSGADITATYPELRELGPRFPGTALLDGEVVVFEDGRPSFGALQKRINISGAAQIARLAERQPVTYLIFDLLHLDGRSCLELEYDQRRRLLESLELRGAHWLTPPAYTGAGAAVLHAAREQRLEGVVAKRRSSRYRPGQRTTEWIKITDLETREVVIGGWQPGEGKRAGLIGSLLVGLPQADGALRYVGKVGTGFSDAVLRALTERLRGMSRRTSPFSPEVPREFARRAEWVEPDLVGEVVFQSWTSDGRLRLPRWRGLRPDRSPEEAGEP
ncbi:non-homologous end-joining DNA ligase [Allokutzneria sp. NRRL B-24872]|uniref:non-homologous end-joining DNA ligase n=1 Tax=Allokutzneria sp. NRRL B-24872 TaxID=1137961 RepID=UPI000A39B3F0|nr:non-homologous end-joining DNA ligase [Allokutzneria sp. NRRL B-24872]